MPLHGKGMLIVFNEVRARDERDFNEWYNREHIDERVNLPGFHRARRYIAVRGSPKYLATYECDTVSDLATPGYLALLANQTPWTQAVMARFTQFRRLTLRVQVDLAHGVGGAVAAVRFAPDPRERKALVDLAAARRPCPRRSRGPAWWARRPPRTTSRSPMRRCRTRAWTIPRPTRPNGWCCWKAPSRRRGRRGARDVQAREPEEFWRFGGADHRHLSAAVRQPALKRQRTAISYAPLPFDGMRPRAQDDRSLTYR